MSFDHSESAIQRVSQRYYQANHTRNWVLACAVILTKVLITAACTTFYSYLKLSKNQELKEMGSIFNYLVFNVMKENMGYGAYIYPVTSLLVYSGAVFLLCGTVPSLIYHLISRESVIEQLRQAD
ncbi:hypothetical protein [Paenibacillus donghaensis]|nr:hypothetical protein [Paenibacillus donghaensis]